MRMMIKNILVSNGFVIAGEAGNGRAAVKKYKEVRPDIVTMDVTMDEMNGIEALSRIIGIDPDAKIVMVSSMGQEVVVRDTIMLGAKGFILKPFNEKQIVEMFMKLGVGNMELGVGNMELGVGNMELETGNMELETGDMELET